MQKVQLRKQILQQLLQKSQIFTAYFQQQVQQQNISNLIHLNFNHNKPLQFGKCEINLPQRIKIMPQKFNRKVMVISRTNKQKKKITQSTYRAQNQVSPHQKYNQLQKLNNCQNTHFIGNSIKSQRTVSAIEDKEQFNNQLKKQINHNLNINQNINQNIGQNKLANFTSIYKSRICSAKLRSRDQINPNINVFLKHGSSFQQRSNQSQTKQKFIIQPQFLKRQLTNKSTIKVSQNITKKTSDRSKMKVSDNKQSFIDNKQSYNLHDKQSYDFNNKQSCDVNNGSYDLNNDQKRYSSFSIKKHGTPSKSSQTQAINKQFQQIIQEQKKKKITFRKELHKTYKRAFLPPPKISAKSYVVYQMNVKDNMHSGSGKILVTINGKNSQQIASLTKIMTCILILEISSKFAIDLTQQIVEIGKFQSSISGTSAQIKPGQFYQVRQLLYGLMLPSGNDASLALGVWGGKQLLQNSEQKDDLTRQNTINNSPLQIKKLFKKDYILRFVEEMNRKASQLFMSRTKYANTHGLVNSQNKSSAIDVALLCEYAMYNKTFAEIVSTKSFIQTIRFKQIIQPQSTTIDKKDDLPKQKNAQLKQRQINWQNTHKLLYSKSGQYIGIKTGITTAAGPCLASCIHHKQSNRKFIIVVLDCRKMITRFKQTQILRKWLYKQQNLFSLKNNQYKKRLKQRSLSLKQDKSEIDSDCQGLFGQEYSQNENNQTQD